MRHGLAAFVLIVASWGCGSDNPAVPEATPTPTPRPVNRELAHDASTLLLLRFDDTTVAVDGERPSFAGGLVFTSGMVNRAALIGPGARLRFAVAGNFDHGEGTLEAWVRPSWSGGDGQHRNLLSSGSFGGVVFQKDTIDNLRVIFNRFVDGARAEEGVVFNIQDWRAGDWHHVAYTWSNSRRHIQLYVDGTLRAESLVRATLTPVPAAEMDIGTDNGTAAIDAALDELRISSVVRSSAEIAASASVIRTLGSPSKVAKSPK
jgi:hypothetical protein